MDISTHSAREDGDGSWFLTTSITSLFQPTPPARTETDEYMYKYKKIKISTHSAREDGDACYIVVIKFAVIISTHSAREDGDPKGIGFTNLLSIFQPTPPARTETNGYTTLIKRY